MEWTSLDARRSDYLPVRNLALELDLYRKHLETDPELRAFVGQMAVTRDRRLIDFGHVEIDRRIAEAIERPLISDEAPRSVLDKAAEESN